MKICISSQGDSLESQVDSRFGRCAYFIIYDTDKKTFKALANQSALSSSGAGIAAASAVANEGVDYVLTGNVGPNSYQVFSQSGIKVVVGLANLKVKEAIEKFEKGELKEASSSNVGDHFGLSAGGKNPSAFGPGLNRGMGKGGGRRFSSGFGAGNINSASLAREEELAMLKAQMDNLQNQLDFIKKRVEEIEKGSN